MRLIRAEYVRKALIELEGMIVDNVSDTEILGFIHGFHLAIGGNLINSDNYEEEGESDEDREVWVNIPGYDVFILISVISVASVLLGIKMKKLRKL